MVRATVLKEEISEKNMRFLAVYLETKNAVLVLISEGEDQLGTLAASVPSDAEVRIQPLFSSVLLGDRNITSARMLAEYVASKTGKISLVSVYLKTVNETEATPVIVKLLERLTAKTKGKWSEEHVREHVDT